MEAGKSDVCAAQDTRRCIQLLTETMLIDHTSKTLNAQVRKTNLSTEIWRTEKGSLMSKLNVLFQMGDFVFICAFVRKK